MTESTSSTNHRKPFNLADALAGNTVVDGYGGTITNLTFYETQGAYCLVGIQHLQGNTQLRTYTEEGHFDCYNSECFSNLFMKVFPTTMYVNIYTNSEMTNVKFESGNLYTTESEAIEKKSSVRLDRYVGTYPITVNL